MYVCRMVSRLRESDKLLVFGGPGSFGSLLLAFFGFSLGVKCWGLWIMLPCNYVNLFCN